MASLYKRGRVWWVKYFRPGSRKPVRSSLETTEEPKAIKRLKILEGRLAEGNYIDLRVERIRFGHLLDLVLTDYRNNARKSYIHTKSRIEGMDGEGGHIRPAFGDRRAITITPADIAFYVESRLKTAKNGTVNRELRLMQRAFTLGWHSYRIPGPHIELLEENNVREGFFDRKMLESLCRHLPEYLIPVARFAFLTAWRIGEIRQLQWRHVDFDAGEIRLDASMTKNKKPRVFRMTAELRTLLEHRRPTVTAHDETARSPSGMKAKTVTAFTHFVFTYGRGKNNPPIPIGDHGKAWANACKAAGLPGRLFHDLRRSGIRQFTRDGIQENVAMKMSGHQTREVFDRYNIVSGLDLDEARMKTEAGTFVGTERTVIVRKAKTATAGKR